MADSGNKIKRDNADSNRNEPLKRLAASSIMGDNIFNPAGEQLGRIKDIMIDLREGKIEYIVIEFGGLLGMNQKYFSVPFHALTIAKEHKHAFILNETKESVKKYSVFDKDNWPEN